MFNENDILGDLERDEKANLVLPDPVQNQLVDRQGNPVNERGFMVDPATGDILEK